MSVVRLIESGPTPASSLLCLAFTSILRFLSMNFRHQSWLHCWNDGRDINEQWKRVNPVEWNSDIIPFSQIWSNLAKSLGHLYHHCSNVGCGRHHHLLVLKSYKRTNRKCRELGTSVFGTNTSTILHWQFITGFTDNVFLMGMILSLFYFCYIFFFKWNALGITIVLVLPPRRIVNISTQRFWNGK